MESLLQGQRRSNPVRLTILFCIFFLISLGLGYPILNRFDPRQTSGLSDVQSYAALVTGGDFVGPPHLRFRVLLPWMAKPIYHLAEGRVGSWDPVMVGLLLIDSLFVAATALLIVVLGCQVVDYPASLVASLLYLLNFAVPNLRLAGLVDAGDGFFWVALFWSLSQREFRLLPFIAALGALTKEAFVPLSMVFTAAWWCVARKKLESPLPSALWITSSWLVSFGAIIGIQWRIGGQLVNPFAFAASLHGNRDYLHHFASSLWDQNLWYIFVWLLPTALPRLAKFPESWLIAAGAGVAATLVLDGYYGGAPGTVGRAWFSIAGPILALSSASFLCNQEPLPVS